jgi:carbonic anhydrase
LVPPYEAGGGFHGVSTAIEFGVVNLGVKRIIVLGLISRWMSMLDGARLRVLASHQMRPEADKLRALEKEGIKTSIANLRTFPFIIEREERGRLSLYGSYFDIATGTLSILDHSRNEFFPL